MRFIALAITSLLLNGCGGGTGPSSNQTATNPITNPGDAVQPWGLAIEFPERLEADYPKIMRLPSGRYLTAAVPTGWDLKMNKFFVFNDPTTPISSFEIPQSEIRGFELGSDSDGNVHIVGRSIIDNKQSRETINSVVFNEKTGATHSTKIDAEISASQMYNFHLATSKSGSAITVISYNTAFAGNTDPNKGSALFASIYSPQLGWSTPVQISSTDQYGDTIPFSVAASDNGKFAVLWEIGTNSTPTKYNPKSLVAKTYDPNSGWSQSYTLFGDTGGSGGWGNYWQEISIANDGTVVAAWKLSESYDSTQTAANIAIYDPNADSWALDFIDFPGRRHFRVNSQGDGILLWEQVINGCQGGVLSIRFKANGTVTDTENLTKNYNCLTSVGATELFFDDFSHVAVVWSELTSGEKSASIGGTRIDGTGKWTNAIRLANDTVFYGIKSNIENGRAGVSWRMDSSSDFVRKTFLDFSITP